MSATNTFVQIDRLKRENESLQKEVEVLADRLQQAEKKLEARREYQQKYSKDYYQSKTKEQTVVCEICEKTVKRSSLANHLLSAAHLARAAM